MTLKDLAEIEAAMADPIDDDGLTKLTESQMECWLRQCVDRIRKLEGYEDRAGSFADFLNTTLQTKVDQLETNLRLVRGILDGRSWQVQSLQAKVSQLQNQLADEANKCGRLEAANENLRGWLEKALRYTTGNPGLFQNIKAALRGEEVPE